MFDFFHKRPYLLYSLIAGFFVLGVYGLVGMPKNLFPDSERPTVIVMSQVPGATPNMAAATVSKPLEQEIASLALIRQVEFNQYCSSRPMSDFRPMKRWRRRKRNCCRC